MSNYLEEKEYSHVFLVKGGPDHQHIRVTHITISKLRKLALMLIFLAEKLTK